MSRMLEQVKKELADLTKEPVHNAGVKLRKTENGVLLDCAILVGLTDADGILRKVALHFVMVIPENYPNSPPRIGFSNKFKYYDTSYFEERPGHLYKKFVLCMQKLGNFPDVEIEASWNPAVDNIRTLLIEIQTLLNQLDNSYKNDRKSGIELLKSAERFNNSLFGKEWVPEITSKEAYDLAKLKKQMDQETLKFAADIEIGENLEKMKMLAKFVKSRSWDKNSTCLKNFDRMRYSYASSSSRSLDEVD